MKYIDEDLNTMLPILLPPLLRLKFRSQEQKNSVTKKGSQGSTSVEQHLKV